MDAINHHTSALLRKLERVASLTPDEKAALLRLPLRLHTVAAHQDLVREGDASTESFLIIEGFACRYTPTDEGKRQILSFHVSGDMPDLQSLYLGVMDHSLATLVPTRLAFVQHGDLRTFIHRHPRFGDLFWHETLIEAAVFRQWIVGLGQRSAQSRIAHLLCELFVRLRAVGLERDHSVTLPLTQAELGDAMGLSTAQVDQVLQELSDDGLISLHGNCLKVLNSEGLQKAGKFDPTYLHLKNRNAF